MIEISKISILNKIFNSLPIIILFISVLNEFDFNYLNFKYFSFNFPFILIFYWSLKGGEKLIKEYKPFVHVEVKGKILLKQGLSSDDVDEYLKSIDYKEVFRISSERVYVHK